MLGQQLTALEFNKLRINAQDGDPVWLIDWKEFGKPNCTVYVITTDGDWPCKIGMSQSPYKRIRSLQTASWKQLYVHKCFITKTRKDAALLEAEIHARLGADGAWMCGEWFDSRAKQAADLVEFVACVEGIEISTVIEDEEIRKAAYERASLGWSYEEVADIRDGLKFAGDHGFYKRMGVGKRGKSG